MLIKKPEPFLKAVPKEIRAVLFFGPDGGLIRERAQLLAKATVPDINDPFNVSDLASDSLKSDPARLADEMGAQSLMGGRRLVRIRDAEDNTAAAVSNLFTQLPAGDSFLIVEGGDLKGTSPLRKLFEGAEIAAAIPCYEAEARDLLRLASDTFKEHKISASQDALTLLSTLIASDRGVARQEIEKLVTLAGEGGKLALEDVAQAIGDSATLDMDDPAWAAGDGNFDQLDRSLERLYGDGISTIAILRAAQRHFTRLFEVAASTEPMGIAIKSLRPPVFWKDADRFERQAGIWKRSQLELVLQRLHQTEAECKTTGLRDTTMCARALMAIASMSRAARR